MGRRGLIGPLGAKGRPGSVGPPGEKGTKGKQGPRVRAHVRGHLIMCPIFIEIRGDLLENLKIHQKACTHAVCF